MASTQKYASLPDIVCYNILRFFREFTSLFVSAGLCAGHLRNPRHVSYFARGTSFNCFETRLPELIYADQKEESSENEGPNSRSGRRNIDETSTREDLDRSHLPDVAQVGQKFRRAEKRRGSYPFSSYIHAFRP